MITKSFSFETLFDVARKKAQLAEYADQEQQPDFWSDATRARTFLQHKARLQSALDDFLALEAGYDDACALEELWNESHDMSLAQELEALLVSLRGCVEKLELGQLLSDALDVRHAIVTINAGAGGTESQDWAMMLLRMYQRWAADKGYRVSVLDIQAGDEAGIKSVTMTVAGDWAYGYLKSEAGVHRLVRISPFDSNARRHTSFSSVYVSAEIEDDFEVVIIPTDLRIDVYRSGGKGGQGVNTTDSAVRITHMPSGIVVCCQQERSQIKNKDIAMKVLRSRLYDRHLEEEKQKQAILEDTKKDIAWGSQIRSYVLHPYKMVKDHRTGAVTGTAEKVLDGDLDMFMHAFLRCRLIGQWARSTDELD